MGIKLYFREYGEGDPIVILHGLFGISDNWTTFGKRNAERYHVLIPDQRNHGQSPHSHVFDYPSMAVDLEGFIEDLDLQDIILIGHSMGGKTAMRYALDNPERLKKLIIVDISPRKYPPNMEHLQVIHTMLSTDLSIGSRRDVENQLKDKIKSQKLRQFIMKNLYWKDKDHLDWRLNLPGIDENLPLLLDKIEPASPFLKPTLFIRGGLSGYIQDMDIPLIKTLFPLAEVKTIPDAGHWVHAEAPEEFYHLVTEFLQ
ncbi:MAG: alpha/beta fold hydrolase [Bacteroidetes bacterium]|nr:alpha/beta fold hydrolase [Bacteroidota bacterium]